MTDFDLERLGDVWRQQPDPAEMERLQRSAAAVSRRARLSQIVDNLVAVAVTAVVIILVFANPRREAFLMGGAAILLLLYGTVRQRKLRQVELKSLTGTTEAMLQQSIERVETTLKHNRFTLVVLGPGVLVGIAFAAAAIGPHGTFILPAVRDLPLVRTVFQGASVAVLAAFALFMVVAMRRGRRELERLKAMRQSYREEHESTTTG
jgi:hypothetical protein